MADIAENALMKLSEALAERVRLARLLVAGIAVPGHRMRSGTLWRKDVVVASEQRFPDASEAKVTLADGSAFRARVAGRDPGTNVVALAARRRTRSGAASGGRAAAGRARSRSWRQ